ncbi:EamA family transporter [Phytoactinopolyspora mesophila]|uniref:EamA family transporter n=1 Tax=Phytoactinopolyspora mesophila TaxID=2650750 RepID=A0A7K3MAQ5_9ACTN|nr:EamA family transporter [Phytoactinopolyspora mesophila]NDL60117.1 EamA family transporter [Phytoactinopolyspora mesophila]
MTRTAPRSAMIWAALGTVYIVWGSTYLAIRVVVDSGIPPFLGMGIRFLIAGLLLLGILLLFSRRPRVEGSRPIWRISAREFRATAVMGVLLLVLGNGVVAIAEQTVPSGLTALIIGAIPLWFVLLRVLAGERPGSLTWLGVLVGLGGLTVISLSRGGIDGVETWGVLLLFCATVSWAFGSFISPRLGLPRNGFAAATYEMLAAGVILVTISVITGEASGLDVGAVPARGWIALAYLVVLGSLLGFTAYVYALAHAPLSLVGTYAYVNPVVAVLLGWAILAEPVTSIVVVGGAFLVGGVALVMTSERTARPTPEDDEEPPPGQADLASERTG